MVLPVSSTYTSTPLPHSHGVYGSLSNTELTWSTRSTAHDTVDIVAKASSSIYSTPN